MISHQSAAMGATARFGSLRKNEHFIVTNLDNHAISLFFRGKLGMFPVMGIRAWITGKWRNHPIMVAIAGSLGAIGSILLFTELVKKIEFAWQLLQKIVNAGIVKPANIGDLQLHFWFATLLNSLVIILVSLAILYVQAQLKWKKKRERALQNLQKSRRRTQLTLREIRESKLKHAILAEKTLEGMMAASSVVQNYYIKDANAKPDFQIDLVEITYIIRKTGDVEVTRRYHVRAAISTVRFWEYSVRADDLACEAPFLDNLNFKVTDTSERGSKVVYLPLKNGARSKKVCIYFLPPIKTDEVHPRILEIKYTWPGLANTLMSKKRD